MQPEREEPVATLALRGGGLFMPLLVDGEVAMVGI